MKTSPVPNSQFALRLQAAMDQANMTLRGASMKINISSEYLRRLTTGDNFPSKPLLMVLCREFGWDFDEMDKMIVEDRFRKKHGVHGAIAQQFNPEVEPFEKGWNSLDLTQRSFLKAQFELFLAQNRRSTRGGKNKPAEGTA